MTFHKDHILAFSCTHFPYEHPGFLDFLISIKNRVKCGTIVCLGDLVDNHTFSTFDTDPNGKSPSDEIKDARKIIQRWAKVFPELYLCRGNHDHRVDLKGRHSHLPEEVFRSFRDIWELPTKWKDDWSWEIDGVRYLHGTGLSGDSAPEKATLMNRQSCVIGHIHHVLKAGYMASHKDRLIYAGVGCGIDLKSFAFNYDRNFVKRPLLGCAVVTDNGRYVQTFPMEL